MGMQITISILIAIVVPGAIWFYVSRRRASQAPNFQDVVKNPALLRRFGRNRDEAYQLAEEARDWGDERVNQLVRRYLIEIASQQEAGTESIILRTLGERTHPEVIRLLADPALADQFGEVQDHGARIDGPLLRACQLLDDAPPREAVEPLSRFLEHSDSNTRRLAACTIAKTGTKDSVPHVKKSLQDADERVVTHTLIGLRYPLKRDCIDTEAAGQLFPEVRELVEKNEQEDRAVEALYLLDRQQAIEILSAPEVLTAESPLLRHVLKTFVENDGTVSRNVLLKLISDLPAEDLDIDQKHSLSHALTLLGRHAEQADESLIQKFLDHEHDRIAKAAVNALLALHGVENYEQRLWETVDRSGFAALSKSQKMIYAVLLADGEINNGGLSQYFFNSAGDYWKAALAGYKAVEAGRRHAILKEALSQFGEQGPSANREQRQEQLSRLFKQDEERFRDLERRYYKCEEKLRVLTGLYAKDHPEDFRK